MSDLITSIDQLNFTLSDLAEMPVPSEVLLVKPTFFEVEYVINPHMKGHIGDVNQPAAINEWETLKNAYDELGLNVHVIDGQRGLPDMVFCANQSFPFIDVEGNKKVLMSIMRAEQRADEVSFIEDWYKNVGYEIHHVEDDRVVAFEGMGDAIWHFRKRLIFGGYGFRTSLVTYEAIAKKFNIPVIALELKDPKFYHLDTCLCSLNENTVLIYPDAFTDNGLELIKTLIPNVIETNKYESEELFACNATCPDGKNVFIQQGCIDANAKLKEAGFNIHEFSTFEYIKSGGSVFCMKMLLW